MIINLLSNLSAKFSRIQVKEVEIEINKIKLKIPVAWVQNKENNDIIIGREIVFDVFDILFKQAEEQIKFILRESHTS